MDYHLGVDLGTTFTAAALFRHGRAEPISLGTTNSVAIPSVAYLGDDGEVVFGQPAVRRAATQPLRIAREFKRRVGDPTPIILAGAVVPAELLMTRLLAWTVEQVAATEGNPPASLAITHPANWGAYKLDLFRQAVHQVGLTADHLVPEPVAAATYYATQRQLSPGSVVAVYDLGGGTFDAALVRSEPSGFAIVGQPDGIERLGGVDFDYALLRHVAAVLDIDLDMLDRDDAALAAALNQLRQACVEAKEALSQENEVAIPVMLPDRHTEVRVSRAELEGMIRPTLDETLVALRRTIASAGLTSDDVTAVLLVGGSSRIPLIGELIATELQRPIAVDARPKDAIPMGAAIVAGRAAGEMAPTAQPPDPSPAVPATPPPAPAPLSSLPLPSGTPPAGTRRPSRESAASGNRSKVAVWVVLTALVFGAGVLAAALLSGRGDDGEDQLAPDTRGTGAQSPTDPEDEAETDESNDGEESSETPTEPQVSDVSVSSSGELTFDVTFSFDPGGAEVETCQVTVEGTATPADCSDSAGSAQVTVDTYNSPYTFTASVVTAAGEASAEATGTSAAKPLIVDGSAERWSGSCYFPDLGTGRPVTEAPAAACRAGGQGSGYYTRVAGDGSTESVLCWQRDVTIQDQQLNSSDVWLQVDGGWMHALYFRDWATAEANLPQC